MTPTEAIEGIMANYCHQAQDCAEAEARYKQGEIPFADYVAVCFLLVYTGGQGRNASRAGVQIRR